MRYSFFDCTKQHSNAASEGVRSDASIGNDLAFSIFYK